MLVNTDTFDLQQQYPNYSNITIYLLIISSFVPTTGNQFGFKQQHGTDMGVFLLNQIVL